MNSTIKTADRIYYTGDMANSSGWFTVSRIIDSRNVELTECDGGDSRVLTVAVPMIGDLYQGHCNPRFVTAQAHAAYCQARRSAAQRAGL